MTIDISVTKDSIGDWSLTCTGTTFQCWFPHSFTSRRVACEKITHHVVFQHDCDTVVITIKGD